MKICWDNLEKIKYIGNNKWRKNEKYGYSYYTYSEKCKICKEPFLSRLNINNEYCSTRCSALDRKFSDKTLEKMSKSHKGSKNSKWNGGYWDNNIPRFEIYSIRLNYAEKCRKNKEDPNILEVKCTYCGKWFKPTLQQVMYRINSLEQLSGSSKYSEQRFYCSTGCKKACPIYGKTPETLMKEDAVRAGRLNWLELNREVQPQLRQLVFLRDDYTCQKCENIKELHCHHIYPVATDPLLSADIDNCITLCVECHKEVHKQDGCKYGQLRICL